MHESKAIATTRICMHTQSLRAAIKLFIGCPYKAEQLEKISRGDWKKKKKSRGHSKTPKPTRIAPSPSFSPANATKNNLLKKVAQEKSKMKLVRVQKKRRFIHDLFILQFPRFCEGITYCKKRR